MASVTCSKCGILVPIRWPAGGDGTVVLAYRHPDQRGQPCEGSGEAHDVGDDDVDLDGLNVSGAGEEELEDVDAGVAVGGVISRRTVGTVVRRVLHEGRVYQLEYRRCGKKPGGVKRPSGCKCMRSNDPRDWHGPYPYAYSTARKTGGGASGGGGWQRLTKFPAIGYRLLKIEEPEK